jgi:hypothetical protein
LNTLRLCVCLTMLSTAMPVLAQGGSPAAPSSRPAVVVTGSSSPAPSHARPSRPSPSSARPHFRGMVPFRDGGSRAPRAVWPLWFGIVTFDRAWIWTPTIVGAAIDGPPISALEQGPLGGVQLDIEPRRALVYVDGWYVGVIDQFSGYYRHLDVGAGTHTFEIVAPDYEPLLFEMAISPGRTTTYRASLQRASGRH